MVMHKLSHYPKERITLCRDFNDTINNTLDSSISIDKAPWLFPRLHNWKTCMIPGDVCMGQNWTRLSTLLHTNPTPG